MRPLQGQALGMGWQHHLYGTVWLMGVLTWLAGISTSNTNSQPAEQIQKMSIRDDDYLRLNYISDLIEDFVAPSHRPRLYYLLSKPKRRAEVIGLFHSDAVFDQRYLRSIPPRDQNADKVYELMKELGATSKCFAFSRMDSPNGESDLKAALDECVGFCIATVLYCRETKIAYWEGDDCARWILQKHN
jgi:hypothetical protein